METQFTSISDTHIQEPSILASKRQKPIYKTLKQRQFEFITNLIRERSFHYETIASSSRKKKSLPLACYKLAHAPSFESSSSNVITFDDKLCTYVEKRHIEHKACTRLVPLSKLIAIKSGGDEHQQSMDESSNLSTNNVFTSNDVEIRHQSAKNWLTLEVYKSEIFESEEEQLKLERKRQQALDVDKHLNKKKSPLDYYRFQLSHLKSNLKRGPLDYDTWARQKYEMALVELNIKKLLTKAPQHIKLN